MKMWGSFYLLTVFAICCHSVDGLSKRFVPLQEPDELRHRLLEGPLHERPADPGAVNEHNSLFRPQISPRSNPTLQQEPVATSATPQAPPTSGRPGAFPETVVATSTHRSSSHVAPLVAEDLKLATTLHAPANVTQTTSAPATASASVFVSRPVNVPIATSTVLAAAVTSQTPSAMKALPTRGLTVRTHGVLAADGGLTGTKQFPKRQAASRNSSSAIGAVPATSTIATSSTLLDSTLKPMAPTTSTASTTSVSTSMATVGASSSPATQSELTTTGRRVPSTSTGSVSTPSNLERLVQPRPMAPTEPAATVSPRPTTPTTKSPELKPAPTSTSLTDLASTGKALGHEAPPRDPAEAPTEQAVPVSSLTVPTTRKSESTTSQSIPTSTSAMVLVSTGGNFEHPAPPKPPAVVPTEPAVPAPSGRPLRPPPPPQPAATEPTPQRPTEPAQPVIPTAPAVPSQQPTEPPLPLVPTERVIPTLPVVPTKPGAPPQQPTVPPQPVVPPHPAQVVTDGYIRTIIQHDTDFAPFVHHKTIEDLVFDQDDHLKQGSCGKCQRKLHYCVQKCFTHHSCEAEQIMTCPRIDAPCFGPFKKEHDQCRVTADCEGVHHLCCLVGCSRRCVPGLLVPIEAHP